MRKVVSVKDPKVMEPPQCVWERVAVFAGVSPERRVTPLTRPEFSRREGCSRRTLLRLPQPRHASSRCGIEPRDNISLL
jgi:hypothetical protein